MGKINVVGHISHKMSLRYTKYTCNLFIYGQ